MHIRVGLIGFGGAGMAHYSYFSCADDVKVTKIYDPKEAGVRRAAEHAPGVPTFTDLDDFWPDLDAVSICGPDSTHAHFTVQALERGLHVLVEKPLADSVEGLRAIHRARQNSGGVVAVGHQMRFVPVHEQIKGLVDQGELGVLSYLEGYYVHDIRERDFAYDDWRMKEHPTPMISDGCHFVDLLRWFAGEEIEEVYAAANNLAFPEFEETDLVLVTLRFRSGVLGKVVIAHAAAVPQDHSVRLYGNKASIENNVLFDGEEWGRVLHRPLVVQRKLLKTRAFGGLQWQLRRNGSAWIFGKGFELLRKLKKHPNWEYGIRFYPVRLYEHALATVELIEDFVQSIRTGREPRCGFDEGARAVLACIAGVESYRTNQPVKVPELAVALGDAAGAGSA